MKATLVHAAIDPDRIAETARAVEDELAPGFLRHTGSRHAYWMAHRASGQLLVLTVWDNRADLEASSVAEAARRDRVAARAGVRILGVRTMDVIGALEDCIDQAPRVRWVRTTWVGGLGPVQRDELPALFREAVPDQLRTGGFCASYWLADPAAGAAVGLSFWEGPTEIRESERTSRPRRRRFEEVLGCTVDGVTEYEAIGVGSVIAGRPFRSDAAATCGATQLRELGTLITRPPGTLLAVSGESTEQVVVILEGRAALVGRSGLGRLDPGTHFGGHRILARRTHAHTVMATTPVKIGVISRPEFADLAASTPEVARVLVDLDADP